MVKTILKPKIRMKSVSLKELQSCPKHILLSSHWTPNHKVDECGANKVEVIKNNKVKMNSNESKKDIELTCTFCYEPFIWKVGEQKFIQHLLEEGKIKEIIPPKRCVPCRMKKREYYRSNQ